MLVQKKRCAEIFRFTLIEWKTKKKQNKTIYVFKLRSNFFVFFQHFFLSNISDSIYYQHITQFLKVYLLYILFQFILSKTEQLKNCVASPYSQHNMIIIIIIIIIDKLMQNSKKKCSIKTISLKISLKNTWLFIYRLVISFLFDL